MNIKHTSLSFSTWSSSPYIIRSSQTQPQPKQFNSTIKQTKLAPTLSSCFQIHYDHVNMHLIPTFEFDEFVTQ